MFAIIALRQLIMVKQDSSIHPENDNFIYHHNNFKMCRQAHKIGKKLKPEI